LDSPSSLPKADVARRLPRHEADNRVSVTLDGPGGGVVRGRCTNVSEAGFGGVLAGEIEPGTEGSAKLTLRGLGEPLIIRAVVRNRHGFTHGFQFLDILPEQRRSIMRWVRSASHEDSITIAAAEAMNREHSAEPHPPGDSTGKFAALRDDQPQAGAERVKEEKSDGE
jgi:hypothetical protein